MARFRYRMQNILNIKEKQEEQQKSAFAAAQMRLISEEERLEELKNRREMYVAEGNELRKEAVPAIDIIENNNAVNVMDEMIASQRSNVLRAEKQVELERQRLTEAMQERKMHERLREKAWEAFLREERAEEAKINDERSSFVYGGKAGD